MKRFSSSPPPLQPLSFFFALFSLFSISQIKVVRCGDDGERKFPRPIRVEEQWNLEGAFFHKEIDINGKPRHCQIEWGNDAPTYVSVDIHDHDHHDDGGGGNWPAMRLKFSQKRNGDPFFLLPHNSHGDPASPLATATGYTRVDFGGDSSNDKDRTRIASRKVVLSKSELQKGGKFSNRTGKIRIGGEERDFVVEWDAEEKPAYCYIKGVGAWLPFVMEEKGKRAPGGDHHQEGNQPLLVPTVFVLRNAIGGGKVDEDVNEDVHGHNGADNHNPYENEYVRVSFAEALAPVTDKPQWFRPKDFSTKGRIRLSGNKNGDRNAEKEGKEYKECLVEWDSDSLTYITIAGVGTRLKFSHDHSAFGRSGKESPPSPTPLLNSATVPAAFFYLPLDAQGEPTSPRQASRYVRVNFGGLSEAKLTQRIGYSSEEKEEFFETGKIEIGSRAVRSNCRVEWNNCSIGTKLNNPHHRWGGGTLAYINLQGLDAWVPFAHDDDAGGRNPGSNDGISISSYFLAPVDSQGGLAFEPKHAAGLKRVEFKLAGADEVGKKEEENKDVRFYFVVDDPKWLQDGADGVIRNELSVDLQSYVNLVQKCASESAGGKAPKAMQVLYQVLKMFENTYREKYGWEGRELVLAEYPQYLPRFVEGRIDSSDGHGDTIASATKDFTAKGSYPLYSLLEDEAPISLLRTAGGFREVKVHAKVIDLTEIVLEIVEEGSGAVYTVRNQVCLTQWAEAYPDKSALDVLYLLLPRLLTGPMKEHGWKGEMDEVTKATYTTTKEALSNSSSLNVADVGATFKDSAPSSELSHGIKTIVFKLKVFKK